MVVDHGSRRMASNEALLRVVDLFRELTPYQLVEPAHMELAEPTIEQAFDRYQAAALKGAQQGDWRDWADMFTLDATYFEHHYGLRRVILISQNFRRQNAPQPWPDSIVRFLHKSEGISAILEQAIGLLTENDE